MAKKTKTEESDNPQTSAVLDAPAPSVLSDGAPDWRNATAGMYLIPIELVAPSETHQPRTIFDPVALKGLADSILESGGINDEAVKVRRIIYPIEPPPLAPLFELIAGERRWRAILLNGGTEIKAEIEAPAEDAVHRKALLSNLQREDLSPLEKSDAFAKEMQVGGHASVEAMAKKMGLTEHLRSIHDLLSLQSLETKPRAALAEGRITMSHAVLIAREETSDQDRILAACFRMEQVDNGAGMERVEVLNSEKQLRAYIRDMRAPAAEQPRLFGTEDEQKDQAQTAALETQADAILEGAPADESKDPDLRAHYDNESTSPLPTAGESEPQADPDGDLDEDDLSQEQRAAVKPQEGGEYEKQRAERLKRLTGIIGRVKYPYPISFYKLLAVHLARKCPAESLKDVASAIGQPGVDVMDLIRATNESNADGMLLCAKVVVTVALLSEINPNMGDGAMLDSMNVILDRTFGGGPKPKAEKAAKPAKEKSKEVPADIVRICVEAALRQKKGAAARWNNRSNLGLSDRELRAEIKNELEDGGMIIVRDHNVTWDDECIVVNCENGGIRLSGKHLLAIVREVFKVEVEGELKKEIKAKRATAPQQNLAKMIAKNKAKAKPSKKTAKKR